MLAASYVVIFAETCWRGAALARSVAYIAVGSVWRLRHVGYIAEGRCSRPTTCVPPGTQLHALLTILRFVCYAVHGTDI